MISMPGALGRGVGPSTNPTRQHRNMVNFMNPQTSLNPLTMRIVLTIDSR